MKNRCDACQCFAKVHVRVRVSLPTQENLKFRDKSSMDLMFLGGKAILHLVNSPSHYTAAAFCISMFTTQVLHKRYIEYG